LVSDIDLLVLSPEIPPGEVVDTTVTVAGRPVDISACHSHHFLALLKDPELVFFHLREIRKLLFSLTLADDGIAELSKSNARDAKPSSARLHGLFESVMDLREEARASTRYTIEFFRLLEDVIFLSMHTRVDTCYSKHKYLLADAAKLPSKALLETLQVTGRTLSSAAAWPQLFESFEQWFANLRDKPPMSEGVTKDTRTLLSHGMVLDAVFPFRHLLIRAWHHSKESNRLAVDSALESLLLRGLCLDLEIARGVWLRLDRLISDLAIELQARR
jgi:hypothetical protein